MGTVLYPHILWSYLTQNPVSDENWLIISFNCRSKIPFSLWQGVHFLISVSSTAFTWRSNILQLCTKFWSTTAKSMVKCALIVSNVKKKHPKKLKQRPIDRYCMQPIWGQTQTIRCLIERCPLKRPHSKFFFAVLFLLHLCRLVFFLFLTQTTLSSPVNTAHFSNCIYYCT